MTHRKIGQLMLAIPAAILFAGILAVAIWESPASTLALVGIIVYMAVAIGLILHEPGL